MRQNIINLSLAGYPTLVRQLTRLATALGSSTDGPIVSLVLFGSVARLMAGQSSDADLLALHSNDATEEHAMTWLIHRIREVDDAQDWTKLGNVYSWRMIPVFGNAQASNLDPDFLANVGQDGVLIYQRQGTKPPVALAQIRSFASWRREVSALVAALQRVADQFARSDSTSSSVAGR